MATNINPPFRGRGHIIPLSEGTFTVDKSKQFVPFDLQSDELKSRTAGSLLVEVQPFIVVTSKDIILLDTGLGFEKNGILQLHKNLMDAGINPSEVTKVLLSHLHKDHSGGIGIEGKSSGKQLSFVKATYFVQQQELTYAIEKESSSYVREELDILQHSQQVTLLDETGVIDDYIHYEVTGAHSPFHQVFRIIDNGEIIFFGGDDAPQLQQMKHRFAAKYDHDGKKAMNLRQQWWEQGQKEKWTFLFYHDVKNPFIKL